MANAYVIPFDFNPVATKEFQNLSYSYTVPAGKFAIVTYALHVTCGYNLGSGTFASTDDRMYNDSNSVCGELRLMAGDVLTRSVSTPTTNFAGPGIDMCEYTNELRVNGNAVAHVSARAWIYKNSLGAGSSQWDAVKSGAVSTNAHISEYNIAA